MDNSNGIQGYFVTGSDTGVGKTWISTQLITQLCQSGLRIKARKPVESGCRMLDDGSLFPADGDALNQACAQPDDLTRVTRYRFQAALAPDQAARMAHSPITLAQLIEAVHADLAAHDRVVVEGAGGFYSPIAEDALNADLARALGLPLIIVVDDRLGAINQALLTIHAAEHSGLQIAALILNQTRDVDHGGMDNQSELQSRTPHPVYRCPHDGSLPTINWR